MKRRRGAKAHTAAVRSAPPAAEQPVAVGPGLPPAARALKWLRSRWALLLFAAASAYALASASEGWNLPLLNCHAFRQTQTAITADYQVGQAPQLAYETPLLGPPWAIPMEFPIYQWITAAVVTVVHTPLDQTGRLVSLAMFWLMLMPIDRLLGQWGVAREHRLVVLTLLVVSPFYMFWSRSFMIESTALTLGFAYLAACVAYLESRRRGPLLLSTIFGSLAGLTKVTTFAPFLLGAVALIVWQFWRARGAGPLIPGPSPTRGEGRSETRRSPWAAAIKTRLAFPIKALLPAAITALLLAAPATLVTTAWTKYADAVKARNPLGEYLTSGSLGSWNFGTLEQRLSPAVWQLFVDRLIDVESHAGVYLLALAGLVVAGRRWREAACCVALYLAALLIFINLHTQWYYAYANQVFLVGAVGIAIVALLERQGWRRVAGLGLFVLAVGVSVWRYQTLHGPLQRTVDLRVVHVAETVRRLTEPDDVILVTGDDWSAQVPYYAGRRALMIPVWATGEQISRALDNLAGLHVGALVAFPSPQRSGAAVADDPWIAAQLARFGLSRAGRLDAAGVQVFPANARAAPFVTLAEVVAQGAAEPPERAAAALSAALEAAPAAPELYLARSDVDFRQHDFTAAMADVDRAAELAPRECEFLWPAAVLRLQVVEQQPGTDRSAAAKILEQALSYADRAVELAPEQAVGHAVRARVLEQLGRAGEAQREAAWAESLARPHPHLDHWGTLVVQ